MLERLFHLRERGASVRTEVLGGITTFVAMAYIIVVNPAILAAAGIPPGPSTVATIVTAAFGSLLMGLYANRPIAVAPYMGENAFIAFGLAALGITWQQRLGAVFLAGALFLALTLAGLRAWLARSISSSMKHAFAGGIGLFLAFIGLYESGIVTSSVAGMPAQALLAPGADVLRAPPVPVRIGELHDARVLLAVGGFLLTALLLVRRVPGAILLGIAGAAAAGFALGVAQPPGSIASLPFGGQPGWSEVALKLDLAGMLRPHLAPVLVTLLLMSFLDTLGTLMGLGAAGGMLDEKGDFPHVERPMTVDAVTCMFAGLAGTSTSGAYIESATGIREGARTGLAAVTTAALFAAALFLVPLAETLQQLRFAYGPALVAVGMLMTGSLARLAYDDPTELIPAFAAIALMLFTYNIANGLTAGLLLYPLVKAAAGRWRELHPGSLALAGLCAVYFLFGLPH